MAMKRACAAALMLVLGFSQGCIYIPATRQYQPTGEVRPEQLIGPDRAIKPGETPLFEALVTCFSHTHHPDGERLVGGNVLFAAYSNAFDDVQFSADGRDVAVAYSLRVGTIVWPIFVKPDTEDRWIILHGGAGGVLQSTTSSETLPDPFRSVVPPQGAARPPRKELLAREFFTVEQVERLYSIGALRREPTAPVTQPTTRDSRFAATGPSSKAVGL